MIWVQLKGEGDRGYVRMVAGPRNHLQVSPTQENPK